MTQIDIIAPEASFRDDRCNGGSHLPSAFGCCIDNHACKPRGQRKRPQLAAFFGDTPGSVDGAELSEKFRGFAERGTWRRVEECKSFRVIGAPLRQIEHE
jgi:hypothetical protein